MSRQISVLFMGRTGNGSSASCNSILKRKAFPSGVSATSTTTKLCHDYAEINSNIIHVVNGPGIGYSSFSETNANAIFLTQVRIAIALNPSGYDAFFITVKFGERFTREDEGAIAMLKGVFGGEFIKTHCILVMTGGDIFERERQETGLTFQEWLDQQQGPFKQLLEECGHRIVLFDNLTEDDTIKENQVKALMDLVQKMIADGQLYTNEMFRAAEASRDEILKESKFPRNFYDLLRDISLILGKLYSLNQNEEVKLREMETLCERCRDLQVRASSIDEGTNELKTITELLDFFQRYFGKIKTSISRLSEEREKCRTKIKNEEIQIQHGIINGIDDSELVIDIHVDDDDSDEKKLVMQKKMRIAKVRETFRIVKAIESRYQELEHHELEKQNYETDQLKHKYWQVKGQWDTWAVSKILERTREAFGQSII